jgi:molecular chaperone DnaJ
MEDYYSVLGLRRDASQDDIKRAYRKLAREYHPDVSSEDSSADRFKEVARAYEVLSDPEKKHRYDLFGEEGQGFQGGFEGFGAPFGDIFDLFFSRSRPGARRGPARGSDLLFIVELSLEEAYSGVRRQIEVPRHERCEDCEGTGVEKGYSLDLCPRCGGQGSLTSTRKTAFGTFSSSTPCSRCGGTGEINSHPCPKCEGQGLNRVVDEIEVDIPAGVDDGDRIRIPGKGEAGERGGLLGDLYVETRVKDNETFTRRGNDLHAVISVSMAEAALGTEVEIDTLGGPEKVHVHAGSQPGDVFRLRGKGMPRLQARGHGDIFLTLEVRIPKKLNAEEKSLMENFHKLEYQSKDSPKLMQRLRKAMRQ